jgi:hypothetical protein
MSTPQIHPQQVAGSMTRLPSAPTSGRAEHHHTVRNAVLALGGAALILAGVAGIRYLQTQPAEPASLPTGVVAVTQPVVTGGATVVVPNAAIRAMKSDVGYVEMMTPAAAISVAVPSAAIRALKTEPGYGETAESNVVVPGPARAVLKEDLG